MFLFSATLRPWRADSRSRWWLSSGWTARRKPGRRSRDRWDGRCARSCGGSGFCRAEPALPGGPHRTGLADVAGRCDGGGASCSAACVSARSPTRGRSVRPHPIGGCSTTRSRRWGPPCLRLARSTSASGARDTLVVERNDDYALGADGLAAVPYAQMLEARWIELVGGVRRLGANAARGPFLAARPASAAGARARVRQAALRVARWLHLARGDAGSGARRRGQGDASAVPPAPPGRAGARPRYGKTASCAWFRIVLKRPFADGTLAVEMDPLWLLARLAAGVPPPRFHTGMPGCSVRRVAGGGAWCPSRGPSQQAAPGRKDEPPKRARTDRPWAKLLERTFGFDVLACRTCGGRRKLLALVEGPASVARYRAKIGEAAELPIGSPSRGPP